MKRSLWLKKTVTGACVFFTFFVTALYLLGVYVDSNWVPTLNMIFSLLLFSFLLSAANSFLFSDKLVFSLRMLIHYVITTVVFYIIFVLWGGFQSNGGSVLTAILVYSFAYLICAIFVFMYRYVTADLRRSNEGYSNVFEEKNSYTPQFDKKK